MQKDRRGQAVGEGAKIRKRAYLGSWLCGFIKKTPVRNE